MLATVTLDVNDTGSRQGLLLSMRRRHQNNLEDIFTTISNGSLEGLQKYLQNGGIASLIMLKAVQENDVEKVKLLIQHNCDVNANDGSGATPVHVAINKGHNSVLEILLDAKADVNTVTYQQTTPLIHAVLCDNVATVKLILIKGDNCDVNMENYCRQTALTEAIIGENKEICELLLKNGASVKGIYNRPLISQKAACHMCSNMELMNLFLGYSSELDLHYHLMVACILQRLEVAEMLLTRFDNPFQLKGLGFITKQEVESVWERLAKSVIKPYCLATKCCKENSLLTMLLDFCKSVCHNKDRQNHRQRAILLIRILVKYGLVINSQTQVRSCHTDCDCRKCIFMALHRVDSVTSLKGQCCSVIRQNMQHNGNGKFDLDAVISLPLPKALKDFVSMNDW